MSTALERELSTATGVAHRATGRNAQPRQDFLRELVQAASDKLSDDAWNGLSPAAQLWVNTGATAFKANEAIADFTPDPEPEQAPAPARPRARRQAVATGNGEGQAAEPATSRAPGGARTVIKNILLGDPAMSTRDIQAKLAERGVKTSDLTITTVRSDFRHSLKVLQEAGKLRGIQV